MCVSLLFSFLLCCVALARARPVPCTFNDPVGDRFYDLSPLTMCNKTGYGVDSGYDFSINFCNQVQNCNSASGCCQDTQWSCGNASTTKLVRKSDGLYLSMTGGDGPCPNGAYRSSNIKLICDPSVDDAVFSYHGENPQCTYRFSVTSKYACPVPVAPQQKQCWTKVFLVPHSHDDVGWLETIEGYYQSLVKHILDTAVSSLMANPNRTFIYVEQAYFYRWWTDVDTTDQQRENLKFLVQNGQWEFVIGGWVMQDEACSTYGADIDQMTLGHQFLYQTFGVKPTKGWQIDPFGASSVTPILNKLSGFDGHIIDRITSKQQYFDAKTAQFSWISNSLPDQPIFSEMLSGGGYCDWFFWMNFNNDPVKSSNVEKFGRDFLSHVDDFVLMKKTPNVLAEWGCDFQFTNATADFHSMDQVVQWLQSKENETFVQVRYSLLSDYFNSVWEYAAQNQVSWPNDFGGDFFPYAPDDKNWWTGYFTSRTELKGFVRWGEAVARAVEQLYGLGGLVVPVRNRTQALENITKLRFANAEAQHHDGVSGTSVPEVVEMYKNHILDGANASMATGANIINGLISGTQTLFNPNIVKGFDSIKSIKKGETIALVFYNSLGWTRDEWVSVPCNSLYLSVVDETGKPLPIQIYSSRAGNVTSLYILDIALLDVPPLGYKTVFVSNTFSRSEHYSREKKVSLGNDIILSNQYLTVNISGSTGRISSITNSDGLSIAVDQNILAYTSKSSGAYVFGPAGEAWPVSNVPPSSTMIQGPYAQIVNQVFLMANGSWAKQSVRLNSGLGVRSLEDYLEITFTLGVLPSHVEVVSRFTTSIRSNGLLYTDDNGYEYLPRSYDFSRSIGGNFFPMIYSSYIEDPVNLLALYAERSHGISSQGPGKVEVMLHRNPDMGDGAGPSLTDTTVVYPVLRLGFQSPLSAPLQLHSQPYLFNFPLVPFSSRNITLSTWKSRFNLNGQLISAALPPNVHLLSVYTIDVDPTLSQPCSTYCVIVRFTHLFMTDEDPQLSAPVVVDLSMLAPIQSASETTLTANNVIQKLTAFKFTIKPKEIRSFVIQFRQ